MTTTTIVRPSDPTLRAALRLAFLFAAIKLAVHVAANLWEAHIGYGYFRDEFYYIACGRHLDWGYVDHGPVVAVQARLSEVVFGKSLAGLRFLSALAGAAKVFLTGMLAWALGGRRPAQGLAMLGVLLVPQYLGIDSFLSMNSFEPVFWMTCLLALVLMQRDGGSERLWLLFGVSGGIGVLNKPSMAFFLVALLAALIVTPQRRLLASKWAAIGVAVLVLIALPNLIWQMQNHWPTWEFLRGAQNVHKVLILAPVPFLVKQLVNMGPLMVLIWGAGLVRVLRRRDERWIGLAFIFFFFGMMAMHAKDYYLSPIYPVLFAAGGIAWETRFANRRRVQANSAFAFPVYATVLIALGIFALPLSLPLMPPAQWLAYMKATGLYGINGNSETYGSGPLPQFYADRFGWQEMVDQVTRIYNSLPPEEQKRTAILCQNYGEASAIDFLGKGLPAALSGHNNYYLWGPQSATYDRMILVEHSEPADLEPFYSSVTVAGRMDAPYSMPFEHRNIFLLSGRKFDPAMLWPREKHYD